jgi:hypothetical protein
LILTYLPGCLSLVLIKLLVSSAAQVTLLVCWLVHETASVVLVHDGLVLLQVILTKVSVSLVFASLLGTKY